MYPHDDSTQNAMNFDMHVLYFEIEEQIVALVILPETYLRNRTFICPFNRLTITKLY